MTELRRQDLAAGLGISRQAVHKLERQGMPTDSVEAARAWRVINLREHMTKGYRLSITDPAPPSGTAEIAALKALWPVARTALDAGRFDLVEAAIRAALRAVPVHVREQVTILDFDVFDRLVAHAVAVIDPDNAAHRASGGVTLSDAEADLMARFWYSVAAGEPIDWTEFE